MPAPATPSALDPSLVVPRSFGSFSTSSHQSGDSPIVLPRFHGERDDSTTGSDAEQQTPKSTTMRAHGQRIPSLTLPSARTCVPTLPLDMLAASNAAEQNSSNVPASAAASSSSASASSTSPHLRPMHFHSTLPDSMHNPLVQFASIRATTGGSSSNDVRGLDDDEIVLEDTTLDGGVDALGSPVTASPRASSSPELLLGQHVLDPSAPIPVPPPSGRFTTEEWSWTHIDYVNEHHQMLSDFFRAIETHSAAFIQRLSEPAPAAPVPASLLPIKTAHRRKTSTAIDQVLPQPARPTSAEASPVSSSTSGVRPYPITARPTSATKDLVNAALPTPSPSVSTANGAGASSTVSNASSSGSPMGSPSSGAPSLLSSTLNAVTSLFSASTDASSSSSTVSSSSSSSSSSIPAPSSTPSIPSYPPNFLPHRLSALHLHAEKDLLRKTKIVSGPMLGEKNPTEKLLVELLTKSGTAPSLVPEGHRSGSMSARYPTFTAVSNGAREAFGHLTGYVAGGVSSSTSSSHTSSVNLNVLPHLQSLDIRMGIHGESLGDALKRNQTLTRLVLAHNVIAEKGCAGICKALHAHPNVRLLDLQQNILYPSCASSLRDLLLYNRTLSTLNLAINKLGSEGVAEIMEALGSSKGNRGVVKMWAEKMNGAGGNAAASGATDASSATAAAPQTARSSTSMALGVSLPSSSSNSSSSHRSSLPAGSSTNSNSSNGGANAASNWAGSLPTGGSSSSSAMLFSGLVAAVSPYSLPGGSNSASGAAAVPALVPSFSINQSLTTLNLSNNKIGPELDALASALVCGNSQLKELTLTLNDVGDVGASYLALALKHPQCPLRSLDLGDNVIGPLGCKVLMAALETNTTLLKLDLSWNQCGHSGLGEGPKSIGRALSLNGTLQELHLVSNQMQESGVKAIAAGWLDRLVKTGASALKVLDLSVSHVGDAGARELSLALAHPQCKATHLSLNRSTLGDEGVLALATAVEASKELRRISLSGNHNLRAESIEALLRAFSRSSSLLDVDIEDSLHIARDEARANRFRSIRKRQFSRLLIEPTTELPEVLGGIIAEYSVVDLRKKLILLPQASGAAQKDA
jgi:Ran GTPase-activating protein (RanGAP) involved in mRNA processing and transport